MSIGIYKITNPKGKIYIGKTKNYRKRIRNYLNLECKDQRKIYNSLKKYGPENHTFEIIEECDLDKLNEREIYWIDIFQSVKRGLNLTFGGDGGNRSKESIKRGRLKILKPILQYNLEGNFIKEWPSAIEAALLINKNPININDCARGKYKSTYGFRWKYKKDIKGYEKLEPIIYEKCGKKWTEDRRARTKNSRKGEKRSKEYSEKIKKLKEKTIYQYNKENILTNKFKSFKGMDGSKIIGTTKLRKILNKEIYYKGYKYSNIKLNDKIN